MSFQAELVPGGARFAVDEGETVLDAALRQGIALEYGCRHGNCSSCKYFLESGDVDHGGSSIYSLSEREREDGYALLCCARAQTDLEIKARISADARALAFIKPAAFDATLAAAEPLTASLWRLQLTLATPLAFHPGQFVELQIDGSDCWRSYSVASSPATPSALEFVIKRVADGAFSGQLDRLRPGTAFSVRGPFGTSYLRAGAAPVLLVATGAGISPLLSILRDAAERDDPRRFEFYYGARTPDDLPLASLLADIAARLGERFDFRPSLSRADEIWGGRRGRVTQALQREVANAIEYDAYLCGAPDMCDAIGALLEAKGVRGGNLFYDKFHAAV